MTPGDKDGNRRYSGKSVVAWGLFWVVAAVIVWSVSCEDPAIAESPYESGDTLHVHVEAMDSSGFAFLPDSAWVEVFRHGAVKETLAYGPDFSQITGQNILEATYVLPSSWSAPFDLLFSGKFISTTKGNGQLLVSPSRVRVNPNLPTVTLTATTTDVTNAVTTSGGTIDNVTLTATTTDVTNAVSVSGGDLDSVDVAVLTRTATDVTNNVTVGSGTVTDVTNPVTVSGGTVDNVTLTATTTDVTNAVTVGSVSLVDSVRAVRTTWFLDEEISASVGSIDSIGVNGVADIMDGLWAAMADGSATIIDSLDCSSCGVYASDGITKLSDVPVYVTSSSTFTAMSDVIGFGWSVTGNYYIRVPAVPSVPDTFYVWAYRQGSYSPSAAQAIVAD